MLIEKALSDVSLAEMPLAARLALAKAQDKKAEGPIISSIGFIKDEVDADVPIKAEPKDEDEVLMDNGLPLPRPEENDDHVHDDVFGEHMDVDHNGQAGETNDDLMVLDDSRDGHMEDGEEQVSCTSSGRGPRLARGLCNCWLTKSVRLRRHAHSPIVLAAARAAVPASPAGAPLSCSTPSLSAISPCDSWPSLMRRSVRQGGASTPSVGVLKN